MSHEAAPRAGPCEPMRLVAGAAEPMRPRQVPMGPVAGDTDPRESARLAPVTALVGAVASSTGRGRSGTGRSGS